MIEVLADYKKIFTQYSAIAFLNKAQRKALHNELMQWVKQAYPAMPDIEEIVAFTRSNNTLKYERPFFLKVVVPCVQKDIEEGSIQALRFLFEWDGTYGNYVDLVWYGVDSQYSGRDLANMILSKEPNHEATLNYKYRSLYLGLDYSIHEVPTCVLSGMNGAEKEEMPEMYRDLYEFTTLSKKLGKDDDCLIEECKSMYMAWEQYLDHAENYSGFEEYLEKHK